MKAVQLFIVVCLSLVYIINCQSSTPSVSPSSALTPTSSITPTSSGSITILPSLSFPSASQSSSASSSGSSSGSASPSFASASLAPSGSPITYAIQFQPFTSTEIYDVESLLSTLRTTLEYNQITADNPLARRDLGGETVYVGNVTSGSSFANFVSNPNNWLARFNSLAGSNVTAADVAVFQVYSSSSQTSSSSFTPLPSILVTPSGSNSISFSPSVSASISVSPSPLPNIDVAVTFPALVTRVINETDDLEAIFAETLNISRNRVSSIDPSATQKRDVPSQTVFVYDNTPAFASFINNPENWIDRFNELAGLDEDLEESDIIIRQLASLSPSTSASTGLTPSASFSPSPAPLQGSCPFNIPFNSTTGICVLPGQTLYLPFTGPLSSRSLPAPSNSSLTVCITVNSPDCMVNPPITGRRQSQVMNSTCSQPFSRFWTQWDACAYDFAPYAGDNQTFIDERNVANTCATNRTTTQISYLGTYFGNWSFSQQPCYNTIRNVAKRQQEPSEQCFCVPYPDAQAFGSSRSDAFFTELTIFQTEDSGVPASIRVICNDFPCYNLTDGLLPPVEYIRYDSSNERALILGIVLGFGLPCLIYCIAAIILAILILLLLLLLGKSTTAKTFWVPSRDDL